MKQIRFFALLFASIAFAACTKMDHTAHYSGGNTNKHEDAAWLSLSIKQSSGLNDPGKENGTASETEISNVKAIFFKYTGTSEEGDPLAQTAPGNYKVVQVIDLDKDQIGIPGQGNNGMPGKAFKVSEKVEYVLLVANHTTINLPAPAYAVGNTFAQVNAAITAGINDVIENGFMMTNATGDLAPLYGQGDKACLQPLKIYSTQSEAEMEGNAEEITLDRVAAKVRVFYDLKTPAPGSSGNQGSAVYMFSWALNVTNTSFYPVSERTYTFLELKQQSNNSNVWPDPHSLGSYRIDPNFSATANTPGAAQTMYNTYTASTPDSEISWKSADETGYCLENTQDKHSNMHAYSTQVLLRAYYVPGEHVSRVDGTNESNKVAPFQDWLILDGVLYTYETLMEWIGAELLAKYSSEHPGHIIADKADELNKYLVQSGINPVRVFTDEELTNENPGVSSLIMTNAKKEVRRIVKSFEAVKAKLPGGSLPDGKLKYYKEGMTYYTIIIKHDSDWDSKNNELGEFGVVRNMVYDIKVLDIKSPGSPQIPTPNPNTPNENLAHSLPFEIEINPWSWYSQEENR